MGLQESACHLQCVAQAPGGAERGGQSDPWKAQHRLSSRYWKLTGKGKPHQKAVTAVARELLGFIWAIGTRVERAAA